MPSPRISISAILALAIAACMTLFVGAPATAARTTLSNATPIVIGPGQGPASPSPSTINVAGMSGAITGVSVRLDRFSHTSPTDVDILLVAPSGESVMVMSDACSTEDAVEATWTFGQGPPILPVVPGPMPYLDSCDEFTYRPTDHRVETMLAPAPSGPYGTSFADFNNENPNGTWQLFVQDDTPEFWTGQIAGGWALSIETGPADAAVPGTGTQGIADPYPLTRTVSADDTVITDVNVTLDGIFHQNPDDLDLLLVGPTGQTVVLMSDACGTFDVNAYGWEWDDEAPASMPDGGATNLCGARTWRPTNYQPGEPWPAPAPIGPHGNSLAGFDLTDPNGEWRLFAQDDTSSNAGFFTTRFTLGIQTRPKATVAFTADAVVVPEGAARTLTLTRSGAAQLAAATVTVTTAPGSATSGADYTPLATLVAFAPGQTEASVPVDALDDAVNEGEETYTVSIASPTGDARLTGGTSATVTIPETSPPPTPPDTSPPQTTIDSGPTGRTPSRKAKLRFSSSEAGSTFECRLDGRRWKPCTSPELLKRLKVGKHRFLVRATDTGGTVDATPAARRWRVTKR
jgi:subtilisin-like proprotein convertase family protein